MSGDIRPRLAIALLVGVILYSLAVNLWFIHVDQRPCNINELSHIMGAIDFVNLAPKRPSLYGAYLEAFNGYPPIGVVTSAFYVLFGREHDVAAAGQVPFTVLLLISLYALGARLVDRKTGLLAAWLAATSPALTELSRQYLLEMPLTALTTLAVLLLISTNNFTNRRWSIAAGLAVGVAALAKQTFFLFMAGPALFMIPGWLRAIREETPPPADRPPRTRRLMELAGVAAASIFLAWFVYGRHRSTIENWFASAPEYQLPYGWIFLVITALLLFAAGLLALGRNTPLRNGLLALVLAVLTASCWYFPKGVLNFVTYLGQMQLNVERSQMSPASLLSFYRAHAATYYLGLGTWFVLAGAAAAVAMMGLTRRQLARWFYLRDLLLPGRFAALVVLWLGVPFAAFFFISIQNEMNTVPLMPPLLLAAAAVVTRVKLPLGAKTKKAIEAGRLQFTPRLLRVVVAGLQMTLVAALVVGGVLMVTPWPDGDGKFTPLPGKLNQPKIVADWFPRKTDPIAYLVPQTESWHEKDISLALLGTLPDVPEDKPAPRVLAMDVEFYFSWNTFWYMAKLMNKRVEIRTPWYEDANILDPASPDYVEGFDRILYRSAFDKVYHEDKIRNDYQSYRHLLAAYRYLQQRPNDFAARFPLPGSFDLPDGTTAHVLRKNVISQADGD